ncbi:MAG: DnaB-like helicase N-terminal domain-containing protein, partial [Desulfopila sp.]
MTYQQKSASLSKVPPQNLEAEQSVLGSILLKENAFGNVIEILKADDFYSPAHKSIFKAMVVLFEKNEPHDIITLTNYLKDTNSLEDIGGG